MWDGQTWGEGQGAVGDDLLVLEEQLRRQTAVLHRGAAPAAGRGQIVLWGLQSWILYKSSRL